jgi:glycine cleavage system transcriptional repressor
LPHLALTAIGRDRPGIVAALSGVLLEHELNIEDSQATILRGHFSIVLVVAAPEGVDRGRLRDDLAGVGRELGLEAVVVQDVDELHAASPEPSHMVTIYGTDHPGIVHAATSTLAASRVDITDLNTRLIEEEGERPFYALMMEVRLPASASAERMEEALRAVGEREGVEVTVREIEPDVLYD